MTDSTAAAVPGAAVRATNVETGIVRQTATDGAGRYRIPELGLGSYSVEAQTAGFQTEVRSGIRLTVGREAVVNLQLQVGAVTERVEVTGEAPLVQTTDSTVSFLVDESTMRDLPLNGRSYTQLATLQPGVTPNNNYVGNISGGTGLNLIVQGQRPSENLFLIDGTIANDYTSRTPAGAGGNSMGVEAIQEFSLLSGNYSAEFGTALGGVVNLVTRNGTNTFHGSVFEFLRNSSLDAKNYFDPKDEPIPPFKRNQFGAALGGPIKRDRVFFFGNIESLLERKSNTTVVTVPNADAHRGILPTGTVPINPAAQPMVDSLPLPNVPGNLDFGDGTGQFVHNPLTSINQHYMMGRIDYQVSDTNSLFGRYTIDNSRLTRPEPIPVFRDFARRRDQFATLRLNTVLSPTAVNILTLGFTRTFGTGTSEDIYPFPAGYKFLMTADRVGPFSIRTPALSVGSCPGCRREDPRLFMLEIFDSSEKVSMQRGSHSLTFGGTVRRYRFNENSSGGAQVGQMTFQTVGDFLRGIPVTFSGAKPGFLDNIRTLRSTLVGVFIQDDIRLTSNLTVNIGLRYEMATTPVEKHGKAARIEGDPLTATAPIIDNVFFETKKKNFAPRLGFSWDPFSTGRTSIRGGGGLFYTMIIPEERMGITLAGQSPFTQDVTLIQGTDPIAFPLPFENPALVLRDVPNSMAHYASPANAPTRYYWTFGIQHEILSNMMISATYSGSRTTHLNRGADVNGKPWTLVDGRFFYAATGGRMNPVFSGMNRRSYDTNSWYNGLSLNVRRRFASGFGGQMSYTWAKVLTAVDSLTSSTEGLNDAGGAQTVYDMRSEWSRGSQDIRHRFVSNLSYDLPFGGYGGFADVLLEGWMVSVIFDSSTGLPYTPKTGFNRSRSAATGAGNDRPNLAPGFTHAVHEGTTAGCPGVPAGQKLGGPSRYFDPCAFVLQPAGFHGNLGRGTLQGPDKFNFDFSVKKTTPITETVRLEFRAETFNVFNHPTFSAMSTNLFTSSGARQGSAGRLTSTLTDSRQIQFGMKLSF